MNNIIQSQPEIKEVPSFLQNPELTKPDSDARHHEKLEEIAEGMDYDDAAFVCKIFARKYPTVMIDALGREISSLINFKQDITGSLENYSERRH